MQDMVTHFENLITEWEQFQGFIDKIRAKSDKFSPAVIEKLSLEYVTKQDIVTEQIRSAVVDVQALLVEQQVGLETLKVNNAEYDIKEQELTLRFEIGAIDETAYQAELSDLKGSMQDYSSKVDAFTTVITQLESVLAKWEVTSGESVSDTGASDSVVEEISSQDEDSSEEVEVAVVENVIEVEEPEVEVAGSVDFEMDDVVDDGFDDLPPIPGMDEAIDAIPELDLDDELGFDQEDAPSPFALQGEDLNFELSNDSLGYEESIELSQELVEPEDLSGSIDLGGFAMAAETPSAMLIRDEGKPGSEAIFPFKGEEYTIGRAADNNIQIKDDNKVSRHHCKLVRRGNQFFVLDLGSSNGTLVNGEDFDGEYKLFGGEEVKVGETLFRFRMQ